MPPSAMPQPPLVGRLAPNALCGNLLTVTGPATLNKPGFAPKFMVSKDPHVPKKTKAAKKGVSTALKSDGHASDQDSDSESSDDELTIEEEEPEMTPAVLTVSAPTDERGRIIYDAVNAVWSPRNKSAPVEKIRSGIASFGDTVRSLRDSWKLKNDNLRKAELPNSPTAAEATRLKEEVARYRSAMEVVMARSLIFGHPAVVKRYVPSPKPSPLPESQKSRHKFELRSYIDARCSTQHPHYLQCCSGRGIRNVVMCSEHGILVYCHNEHTHSCLSIDLVQPFASSEEGHNPVILRARPKSFCHESIKPLLIIIYRLGENQFTMSALYSFMLDRFNAGDYDSTLVSNILKVRFCCPPDTTLDG